MSLPPLLLQSDPFQLIQDFLNSPVLKITGRLIGLLFIILWLSLVYWTIADASRRGAMRIFWGLVAILFPFLGTLIYLIVRPPEYELDRRERELELAVLERDLRNRVLLCPNCRAIVERDYFICPECSWELKKPCLNCEKPLDLNWPTCPYCKANQRTGKRV